MHTASKYLFLLPVPFLLLLLKQNIINFIYFYKIPHIAVDFKRYKKTGIKLIPPYVQKLLYKVYKDHVLKFSNLELSRFMFIKAVLFITSLCLLLLVRYTNIAVQSKTIINSLDYRAVMLDAGAGSDRENEVILAGICIKKITSEMFGKNSGYIKSEINRYLNESSLKFGMPSENIINRVYTRLYDYYQLRKHNFIQILFLAFAISLLPEVYLLIQGIYAKSEAAQELRLLKKLVIINGSIKPVDFKEVLDIMIKQSKYYRKLLESIRNVNKQNSKDMTAVYASCIKASHSINEKLFLEKLDQANNYDFDQAVKNIENEFMMEKREVERSVKKRIELIHAVGVTGMMLLILVSLLYLIVPWLKLYNMSQLGI